MHCDSLFVNLKGMPHQDIGICVTRLYREISDYHITTTTLRSLFETEASEAMGCGNLSPADCAEVIRNNGHSSATAHNHYLKRKAEDAGRKAMEVHKILYGADDGFQSPAVVSSGVDALFVQDDDDAEDEDDQFKPRRRRRIDWSTDEVAHLSTWIAQFELDRGRGAAKDWRACLKVMADTTVFHTLHLTTTALREAWRREGKKVNSSGKV
jgi:hypothetical protein